MAFDTEFWREEKPAQRDLTIYHKSGNNISPDERDAERYCRIYSVKFYGGARVYKIVKFKRSDFGSVYIADENAQKDTDGKLANNLVRARTTVFELVLCNEWEHFATLTLDQRKYDRYDLDKFAKDISQFIRDKRKRYGTKLAYLLIPEQHKDGAWHMHGLFNGIPADAISEFVAHGNKTLQTLKRRGYKNWQDYADSFGFVSLSKIKDKLSTAFYITKYISKDMSARVEDINKHLYYASLRLKRAEKAAVFYTNEPELDKYCDFDTEFCKIGMVYAGEQGKRKVGIPCDPDFSLPDGVRDWEEYNSSLDVYFPPAPANKPKEAEVVAAEDLQKIAWKEAQERARRELGLDMFEHVTHRQISLLNGGA